MHGDQTDGKGALIGSIVVLILILLGAYHFLTQETVTRIDTTEKTTEGTEDVGIIEEDATSLNLDDLTKELNTLAGEAEAAQ